MESSLKIRETMDLEVAAKYGEVFSKSGLFKDTIGAAQAIVKILAGAELGLSPMTSMQGINIIQGKVAFSSNLMAARVKSSKKYDYKILEHTDHICRLMFLKSNGTIEEMGESVFTIDEAAKTKQYNAEKRVWTPLSEKHNWKNYPKNMLFARALSNGVKWYCPDLGVAYTIEEMEDVVIPESEIVKVKETAARVSLENGSVAVNSVEETLTDEDKKNLKELKAEIDQEVK